jgi:hypothetical protein
MFPTAAARILSRGHNAKAALSATGMKSQRISISKKKHKLFCDYEINNSGSLIKSNKFIQARERITFGEKSSRGSGVCTIYFILPS